MDRTLSTRSPPCSASRGTQKGCSKHAGRSSHQVAAGTYCGLGWLGMWHFAQAVSSVWPSCQFMPFARSTKTARARLSRACPRLPGCQSAVRRCPWGAPPALRLLARESRQNCKPPAVGARATAAGSVSWLASLVAPGTRHAPGVDCSVQPCHASNPRATPAAVQPLEAHPPAGPCARSAAECASA